MRCLITYTVSKKQSKPTEANPNPIVTEFPDRELELTNDEILGLIEFEQNSIIIDKSTNDNYDYEIEVVNL